MLQAVENVSLYATTHDTLDELFAAMVRSAHAGDWLTCDEFSDTFAIALDVHLRHEENIYFPRYAARSEIAAVEVEEFLLEHTRIRRAVGRLLAGLRRRELDYEAVGAIELRMREHDSHERTSFLPWLAHTGHEHPTPTLGLHGEG
ncbi:hemerythrin domain-containing protein [Pseudenhygromyxa sp. WMMC2535]|uniref:hemerythrin domain-containing protein n=1 Tax=Pseudenhygromyxa sp. WMMC2535 TaxID=2712867 RepID=UPI00155490FD|nr:hemerythrin domain-containing protein [Pseudenhygromyxa sp. WMMC2535]NVB41908.1 hemerythrin domain-containing protein [Pseudenhygromyxa sp. WMMC2535]